MLAEAPQVQQPELPGSDTERWTTTPYQWAAQLHQGGYGTVSVGRKSRRTGDVYQRRMPVERGIRHSKRLRGSEDVYLAPNRFGAELGTQGLIALSALYADLDYYNVPALAGLHPYEVLEQVLTQLTAEGIPAPTHAIASGRGLQLTWQFSPIKPDALPRWQAAARRLTEVLSGYGVDRRVSTDAARVLRVPGSTHSGTGRTVEPLLPVGETYTFGVLVDAILPVPRGQLRDLRAYREARRGREVGSSRPAETPAGYGAGTLGAARLRDLRTLRDLRGGAEMSDYRSRWLCHATVAAGYAASSPEGARAEARRLAGEVAGWSTPQADTRLGTIVRRVEAAHRGEVVEYQGQRVDPRYRYRSQTIIADLCITPAEQANLETLISPDERRRRRREKARVRRRAAGVEPRTEYVDRAAQRRHSARRLAGEGYTRREIAAALGVSKPTVTGYLRQSERETGPPAGVGAEPTVEPQTGGGSKCVTVYVPPVGGPSPDAPRESGTDAGEGIAAGNNVPPPEDISRPPVTRSPSGERISDPIPAPGIRAAGEPSADSGVSGGPRQPAPGTPGSADTEGSRPRLIPSVHHVLGGGAGSLPRARRDPGSSKSVIRGGEPGRNGTPTAERRTRPPGESAVNPAEGPENPVPIPIAGQIRITPPRGSVLRAGDRPERGMVPAESPPLDPAERHYLELGGYLGRTVATPRGRGTLWQLFRSRAGVVLDATPHRVSFLDPAEVEAPESPTGELLGKSGGQTLPNLATTRSEGQQR